MDSTPIANELESAMPYDKNNTPYGPRLVEANQASVTPNRDAVPDKDFLEGLVSAQHHFIQAQHSFLLDADVTAYLAAQRNLIAAQDDVLYRLGVFG